MSNRLTKFQLEQMRLSKNITKWILFFWGLYRICSLVVGILRPEIIGGLTALTTGVDDLAMVVVISYLVHSGSEAAVTKYFENKAIERKGMYSQKDDDDDEDEEYSNG